MDRRAIAGVVALLVGLVAAFLGLVAPNSGLLLVGLLLLGAVGGVAWWVVRRETWQE